MTDFNSIVIVLLFTHSTRVMADSDDKAKQTAIILKATTTIILKTRKQEEEEEMQVLPTGSYYV